MSRLPCRVIVVVEEEVGRIIIILVRIAPISVYGRGEQTEQDGMVCVRCEGAVEVGYRTERQGDGAEGGARQ